MHDSRRYYVSGRNSIGSVVTRGQVDHIASSFGEVLIGSMPKANAWDAVHAFRNARRCSFVSQIFSTARVKSLLRMLGYQAALATVILHENPSLLLANRLVLHPPQSGQDTRTLITLNATIQIYE